MKILCYLDTCILASYIFKNDEFHLYVKKILDELNENSDIIFCISVLSILELLIGVVSCILNNRNKKFIAYLDSYIKDIKDNEEPDFAKIVYFFNILKGFLEHSLKIKVYDDKILSKAYSIEYNKIVNGYFVNLFNFTSELILSGLKMKLIDTLHIVYASKIREIEILDEILFMTLDKGILNNKDLIKDMLKVCVLKPRDIIKY